NEGRALAGAGWGMGARGHQGGGRQAPRLRSKVGGTPVRVTPPIFSGADAQRHRNCRERAAAPPVPSGGRAPGGGLTDSRVSSSRAPAPDTLAIPPSKGEVEVVLGTEERRPHRTGAVRPATVSPEPLPSAPSSRRTFSRGRCRRTGSARTR